MHRELQEAE
jgi:hypothetical protein